MIRPKGKALKIAKSVLKRVGGGVSSAFSSPESGKASLPQKDRSFMQKVDKDKKHIAKGY